MKTSVNILLGVTGSIAAYKSADLIARLREGGYQVRVIMTDNAKEFITPLTLATLSRYPVHTEQFFQNTASTIEHIALARWADLVCIAPASANFICKYAAGFADNLLLTELLAFEKSVVVAPAMNSSMYHNSQVQKAIQKLTTVGVHFVEPAHGELACGEIGIGKMAEVTAIVEAIETDLKRGQLLKGKRVVITAGATRNYLDPVRFISSPASGKMGFALAQAAKQLGGEVILIAANCNTNLHFPGVIAVETTAEMHAAVLKEATQCDIFIGAAAIADFSATTPAAHKTNKQEQELHLRLKLSPDIIAEIATMKNRPPLVIGFSAETHDHRANGLRKLKEKNLDYIFVNDVSQKQGFAVEENAGQILSRWGDLQDLPKTQKLPLAFSLLTWIYENYQNNQRVSPTQLSARS